VNDRLLVEMRFGARHIWRVGHSGGPHVLLVSRSPSSLPFLLSRSLVRLLPRIFNYSHGMEVGKVKVGRMGNETMGEEVWDLPWHSRALNSADVDRETSTLT
jgi:hypothetical protein